MEIRDVIQRYKRKLFSLDQVIGVGRGFKEVGGKVTDEEAIQVLVRKKLPESALYTRDIVPRKVSGITTDVIEIGEIHALRNRTDRIRPAQPGISIGHYLVSAGTFGAVVFDKETGDPFILSNNHILANTTTTSNQRAKVGDPILQPGEYDGGNLEDDIVGFLYRYIPLQMKDSVDYSKLEWLVQKIARNLRKIFTLSKSSAHNSNFNLYRQGGENMVDCALAIPIEREIIKTKIIRIGQVAGVRTPEVGEILQKSGRTSGVTSGRVRTLDATLTVQMGTDEEAIFTDQILVDMYSDGGDSGSLVLDRHRNACGLLFAGSQDITVCNPIQPVLDALDVTF